jgi:glyoxylase-like metal-dependent hydrolase (beta-lactamase superfamily II)
MKVERVGERVYADFSGEGKGNIGAIELTNLTIVVDSTISEKTALKFRSSLEPQIKSPIQKLIITHYHADHTLGIPAFKNCDIIASKPYKKLRKTTKHQPTQTFEGTLILRDEASSIEISHVGGHTKDSVYVYFPQDKTLFSGDLIFAKTFFYAGDKTFNPEKWRDILKHLIEMDIERIIPGHGPLCDKEEVRTYHEFFETTCTIMKELVQNGLSRKEALNCKEIPTFYTEYREGLRKIALANWYKFYKERIN